jgi:hypothetical protein
LVIDSKLFKKEGMELKMYGPVSLYNEKRKNRLPFVVFFHGVIQNLITTDNRGNQHIFDYDKIPGVGALLDKMSVEPFVLIVPSCPGYQWPFIFKEITTVITEITATYPIEISGSSIGTGLGASWMLHYSSFSDGLIQKSSLINPGNLDYLNSEKLAKEFSHFPIYIHHTLDNDDAKNSTEFRSSMMDHGKYDIFVDQFEVEEKEFLNTKIKQLNIFV